MQNQMQPSVRTQGFGMQNGDLAGTGIGSATGMQAESTGIRSQPAAGAFGATPSQAASNVAGGMMQATPASAPYASSGSNMQAGGYGGAGTQMQTGAANMNTQQLSYDQFQEQVRQRQEQEQQMARQALLSAGADRQSDRTRAVLQQLATLSQEIQRAENQIQVQMDAQLRQLQMIHQRVRQAENMIQETLPNMNVPSAGLRQ